jgi:hypothetical protein
MNFRNIRLAYEGVQGRRRRNWLHAVESKGELFVFDSIPLLHNSKSLGKTCGSSLSGFGFSSARQKTFLDRLPKAEASRDRVLTSLSPFKPE